MASALDRAVVGQLTARDAGIPCRRGLDCGWLRLGRRDEVEGGASGQDLAPRRGVALAGLPGASADHRLEFRCLSHDVGSFFKSLGLQAPASKSAAEEKKRHRLARGLVTPLPSLHPRGGRNFESEART